MSEHRELPDSWYLTSLPLQLHKRPRPHLPVRIMSVHLPSLKSDIHNWLTSRLAIVAPGLSKSGPLRFDSFLGSGAGLLFMP